MCSGQFLQAFLFPGRSHVHFNKIDGQNKEEKDGENYCGNYAYHTMPRELALNILPKVKNFFIEVNPVTFDVLQEP